MESLGLDIADEVEDVRRGFYHSGLCVTAIVKEILATANVNRSVESGHDEKALLKDPAELGQAWGEHILSEYPNAEADI